MKNLTEVQKAYIAGFVDGEGAIGINTTGHLSKKGYKCYTVYFKITNTNKDVLNSIRSWSGLWQVKPQNLSNSPIERFSKNCKPQWKWQLFSNEVRMFLPLLLPYLQIKKRVAELVLTMLGERRVRGRHLSEDELARNHQLYLEAKKLNQRGFHASI